MGLKKIVTIGGIFLLLMVVAFWFIYRGDKKADMQTQEVVAKKEIRDEGETPAKPKEKKKKIKYWVAPMDPTYIRDKPGKSPMGMDLIPVYEDEEDETVKGTIKIDPVTVQNIGVRTSKVTKGELLATIRTVGHITYDEELLTHIHTKISGWVEILFVDKTGEEVTKGQPLLSIYSPELVATQEEYLQAIKYKKMTRGSRFAERGADTLLESTRRRLLLMDITPEQIEALEKIGEVLRVLFIPSPTNGVIIHKNVLEGMKVDPGTKLYTVADLSRVWVIASVYEYELPFLRVGQKAEMSLAYEPGSKYEGHITFIYPYLSAKTRTAQVRIEFDNPYLKLKPDMYADVVIKSRIADSALLVPSESVIRTGSRNVVITSIGDGKFLPKEVVVGPEGEGFVQIISGLNEGETIVTSGQFLIDSESNLREAINKMLEAKKITVHKKEHEKESDKETRKEMKKEEKIKKIEVKMSKEQKALMSKIIEVYINTHIALASESLHDVAREAKIIGDLNEKLRALDHRKSLKVITDKVEETTKGLLSGDLDNARASFAGLSKVMVGYIKGSGREGALSSGLKIYICSLNKEYWIQKREDILNPYLGEDVLICGTEEKY